MTPQIEVKLLTPTAKCPTKGSSQAAGYDIYADCEATVTHDCSAHISTGIAVKIPDGYVGIIKPRSGLAFRQGVDTMAGVIDSDYRGELKVLLATHGSYYDVVSVSKGDRIAQLLIVPCLNQQDFKVVDDFDDETERGSNGFGSTGV